MNVSRQLCKVFGHQPQYYEYSEVTKTTDFYECSRCTARKNLTGQGWIDE